MTGLSPLPNSTVPVLKAPTVACPWYPHLNLLHFQATKEVIRASFSSRRRLSPLLSRDYLAASQTTAAT